MIFLVANPFSGERFEFEDNTSAEAKASEIRSDILAQEEYRFTIAKEMTNGNDTTWINADLDNDPEDGTYFVFNTFTGQHEKMLSLTAAKQRKAELKAEFINTLPIVPVFETDAVQPISQGAQTL